MQSFYLLREGGKGNDFIPWYPQEAALIVSRVKNWFSDIGNPTSLQAVNLKFLIHSNQKRKKLNYE